MTFSAPCFKITFCVILVAIYTITYVKLNFKHVHLISLFSYTYITHFLQQ